MHIAADIDVHRFCGESLALPPASLDEVAPSHSAPTPGHCARSEADAVFDRIPMEDRSVCAQREDLPPGLREPFTRSHYESEAAHTETPCPGAMRTETDPLTVSRHTPGTPVTPSSTASDEEQMNGDAVNTVNGVNGVADAATRDEGDCGAIGVEQGDESTCWSAADAERRAAEWSAFDPDWRTNWPSHRCDALLRSGTASAELAATAAMHQRYWRSKEQHSERKRKREGREGPEGECAENGPPPKKRKTGKEEAVQSVPTESDLNKLSGSAQRKITDYLGVSQGGVSGDEELAKALSMSLETARCEDAQRGQKQKGYCWEAEDTMLQRALSESMGMDSGTLAGAQEEGPCGSAGGGKGSDPDTFEAVCDEEVLRERRDVTQYSLRSVVRHLGSNYQCGHYVTDVLTRGSGKESGLNGDVWERHDDQFVERISSDTATNDIAQKNAYIFFYVHRSATGHDKRS